MKMLEEDENSRGKRIAGKAIALFVAVMILLTFFSNTINNFSLPKVTVENPSGGALIKQITSNGNVEAKTITEKYLTTAMKVTDVSAKAGDTVTKGQVLMNLDTSELKNQLLDEQDRLAQKKLALERLLATSEKLKEINSPESLLNLDKSVETARQNAEKAQKNYDASTALYEAGGISENELADAKTSLDNAKLDYEIAKNSKDKAIRDNAREIANNERDIESTNLDIDMAERTIETITEQLGMGTVTAPCDGILLELNFSEGMMTNSSQPLYKIADSEGGLQFTAAVDISAAEYLKTGDAAEITINDRMIQGTIDQITDNQQQIGVKKDVTIDIPADGLVGGESGTMDIKKSMGSFEILVPNSALGQDNNGYFVYVLKRKEGPLGNEFYVQKVTVQTGDSDNLKTAVLNGLTMGDEVVASSDKSLSDNARVMPGE